MSHGNNLDGDERNEPGKSNIRRRRFLSGVGFTTITSPIVGSAAANKSADSSSIFERANEIRARAGQRAWKKYLRAQGVSLASVGGEFKESDDGVSIQKFDNPRGSADDCDICLEFSLAWDSFNHYYVIDCHWEYDAEAWFPWGGGEVPNDGLGLYYNPLHWDFEANSISETSYTSNKGVVSATDTNVNDGLAYLVDDLEADNDGTSYFAGLRIRPIGDYSPYERYVYGEYILTFNGKDVQVTPSLSFSGGLSLSFETSDDVDEVKTTTEGDGDTFMKINQSDAEEM